MVERDIIDTVISLPSNLFYGTGIPACILILNKYKSSARKNKILFIYAAKDYEALPKRDRLRQSDINKIVAAHMKCQDVQGYCHVANDEELKENEFNLNVPRYVDISEPEIQVDIQNEIDDLKKLEEKRNNNQRMVEQYLNELGFKA